MRQRLFSLLLGATLGAALLSPVPGVAAATPAEAPPNVAPTPPLGWNSWNTFACDINDQLIRQTADAMVSSGMAAAGYKYVTIDDCWMARERVGDRLVPDPVRFPNGIKALADYVHSRGLKLGIYSSAGTQTCQGFPASLGNETIDAQTFASWEVDLLKYDNCFNQGVDAQTRYKRMGDALQATGRPILYSICEWGKNQPWLWGSTAGGHMWRTTDDITDNWPNVMKLLDEQVGLEQYSGPNKWNDPDMLEVGNPGLTYGESRAHMSLWALLNAPLIAGNDLRSMPATTRTLLTDPDVLAVNQDWAGRQGAKLRDDGAVEVWSKKMSDGSAAVVLLNRSSVPATIRTTAAELGLPAGSAYTVKNLWSNEVASSAGVVRAQVASHDVAMFTVKPGAPADLAPMVVTEAIPAQPYVTTAGGRVDVPVTAYNDGPAGISAVRLGLTVPSGWTATPAGSTDLPSIAAGQSGSVRFVVAAVRPAPGRVAVTGTASWTWNAAARSGSVASGFTVANPPPAGQTTLSDHVWAFEENYWGPVERNRSVGEQPAGDGKPLTVAGTVYQKGLGAHAFGRILFYLAGECSRVTMSVGIDDEVGNLGDVQFELWGDDRLLAGAQAVGGGGAVPLSASLTGVQVLELRTDPRGWVEYDHADWLNPQIHCAVPPLPAGKTRLGDWPWVSVENGWGPLERNLSVGELAAGDGRPLTVAGVQYPSGLGGHPVSKVIFDLGRKCTTFTASVGIDDEVGNVGQARFEVWGDGARLAQVDATGAGGAIPISTNVTGLSKLELAIQPLGSVDFAHADWLTPEVTCS